MSDAKTTGNTLADKVRCGKASPIECESLVSAWQRRIAKLEAERDSIRDEAKERGYIDGWNACEKTMVPRARDEALEEAADYAEICGAPKWVGAEIRALKGGKG